MSQITEILSADAGIVSQSEAKAMAETESASPLANSAIVDAPYQIEDELNYDEHGNPSLPDKTVMIKIIDTNRFHGATGKEAFAIHDTIEALYDATTGRLATGLHPNEKKFLEDKYPGLQLDNTFDQFKAHPFWHENKAAKLKLEFTSILDLSNWNDFIHYKLAKANVLVANSYLDYRTGKWENATHYIHDEESVNKVKSNIVTKKKRCYEYFNSASESDLRVVVEVITGLTTVGKSFDWLQSEVDKLIENKTNSFYDIINANPQSVKGKAFIVRCINKALLRKADTDSIFFNETKIGNNLQEALDYLSRPENQDLKLRLKEQDKTIV